MKKNTLVTCLVGLVFLFTMAFGAVPAAAANLSDINGHWAQSQITDMASQGVISGYPDGTFQPDKDVTRAEFMSMVNRAFGFTAAAETSYPDVQAADWFAPQVSKAVAAGYITGYPDGTMGPNNKITRQEAAIMAASALKLDTTADTPLTFKDAAAIPVWSQKAVAAMAAAGCINGYPDGTFKAENAISRAEAAVILSKAVTANATVYGQAGTYGPETETATIDGNVTISAAGVILQNTVITGNLLIAESVGDGDVTLKNVTVKGTTTVKGGGSHSVVVDNSNLGNVVVNKSKGDVRIVVSGTTTIVQVTLASGAILEESNLTGNGFAGVTIDADGAVTLNGSFGNVTIEGANANVAVTNGTIANLTIADSAADTTLDIAGKATITSLTTNAVTSITGTGTISTANYNVNGVTTTIKPDTANSAEGVTPPTPSTSTGGGGGGGSTTTEVSTINVSLLGQTNTVSNDAVSFDLTGSADSTAVSELVITTDPSAAINDATLEITNIRARGIEFITDGESITTTVPGDGTITTADILGNLQAGSEVSLGTLRTIFGSGTVSVTGKLTKTGYKFNSGNDMTISITLGPVQSATPIVINNGYVEIYKSGTKTATVTVLDPDATVSEMKGDSVVDFSSVVAAVVSGTTYNVDADFKAKIQSFIDSDLFDDLQLSQLIGKSVTFSGYTVNFVAEP